MSGQLSRSSVGEYQTDIFLEPGSRFFCFFINLGVLDCILDFTEAVLETLRFSYIFSEDVQFSVLAGNKLV